MRPETGQNVGYLIFFCVISLAITGYFIGLKSPMNPGREMTGDIASRIGTGSHDSKRNAASTFPREAGSDAILATHYADMHNATLNRAQNWRAGIADLESSQNTMAEVIIAPELKAVALDRRKQNRAFNGSPPTVPHPIDQLSAASCLACHGEGIQLATLRIPKMSHQILTNCTQCHVDNSTQPSTDSLSRDNSFVGLPAPTGGPRAFDGAPPVIPHSTWMRVDCMSCHGFTSLQGIRTTHPWRQNCQQCHAPSSDLEQIQLDSSPAFLPPIKIQP